MSQCVAIIEDVPGTQEEFGRYVKNLWPEAAVTLFLNAESAVESLKTGKYDIVITDIELGPGLQAAGGFTVAHALAGTNTPLIVVSGAAIPDEYRLAFRAMGAWDYIQKPVQEFDLRSQLERAILFREARKKRPVSSSKESAQTADARLTIDIGEKDSVKWNGKRVLLSMTGIRILQKLLEQPNQAVKYEVLFGVLKSGTTKPNLRQHIKEMRAAFVEAEESFDAIQTIQFVGYSWTTR